jgi:hypothetical protein
MRVMVMIKGTPGWEAGEMPDERLLTAMTTFNEELMRAGILLDGEGLHPSSDGVLVRYSGTTRTVTDGPYSEAKDLVAGYWLWQVRSMDEAIEWAKRCPNPMTEDSEIEIRPVFEAGDFAAELTPAAREGEDRLRHELTAR